MLLSRDLSTADDWDKTWPVSFGHSTDDDGRIIWSALCVARSSRAVPYRTVPPVHARPLPLHVMVARPSTSDRRFASFPRGVLRPSITALIIIHPNHAGL